ncbi:MAG: hypothetical protein IMZ46_12445 [Acidobacteria bacterium]|nr:hypothetical protein [Acidobacteriota bacterium]
MLTPSSGHVNLAAVGQFYSHPRFNLPKHKDFRYMPNITASPIANRPAPNHLVDMLNKRSKVHHFDKDTDEAMIPLFTAGVDGRPRGNQRLLPHRNWCSIRAWAPGNTPAGTEAAASVAEEPVSGPPERKGSLFRRFSRRKGSVKGQESVRGQDSAQDVSRPPISGSTSTGGFFRSLSRRKSDASRPPPSRSGKLTRSLSVQSAKRLVGLGKPPPPPQYEYQDDQDQYDVEPTYGNGHGHVHGYDQRYVEETEPYSYYDDDQAAAPPRSRLRGGADREYEEGDEEAFTARPVRAPDGADGEFRPKPFHRTPTGLSVKQRRRADDFTVDLEGGLDICVNVEVSPRDPAGITVPYRLLVPRLFHDEDDERRHDEVLAKEVPKGGFKRFLSFGRKASAKAAEKGQGGVQAEGTGEGQEEMEVEREGELEMQEGQAEGLGEQLAAYQEQLAPRGLEELVPEAEYRRPLPQPPKPQPPKRRDFPVDPEDYDVIPPSHQRSRRAAGPEYPEGLTPPRQRSQRAAGPEYHDDTPPRHRQQQVPGPEYHDGASPRHRREYAVPEYYDDGEWR